MKKSIIFLFVLITLITCARNKNEKYLYLKFQKTIDSLYNVNQDAKGIMVHIESPINNISWSGAAGYSDFINKQVLEADQPALIASNTKTYVSAAILRLVERGEIQLNQPVKRVLTQRTKELFLNDGYDLDSIKVIHLMSHTSGIYDYWDDKYVDFVNAHQKHRWTRNEQLKLAVTAGKPIGKPGETFSYADVNYLLLTEIIEVITHKPFYKAMRELLRYKELGLNNTWFVTLEKMPNNSKPLVHQYFEKYNWDSYNIDPSWDLYGGGGIASNTRDLARFCYDLFNGKVIKDTSVFKRIFTHVNTQDSTQSNYHLGLAEYSYNGIKGFGHDGYWGTVVVYFPELKTSMAVFVLERRKSYLSGNTIEKIIDIIKPKVERR